MRTQSADLIAEKAKSAVTTIWLVEIDTNYFTSNQTSFSTGGKAYAAYPMEISNIDASDADSPFEGCTVKLGNVDLALSSMILNNTIKEKEVLIYEAWLDSSSTVIATELKFFGMVRARPSADEEWATIPVSSVIDMYGSGFGRAISRLCTWRKFKDTDCGYAGAETSCNRTYTRCDALSNTARYGGFRWLPAVGKPIEVGAKARPPKVERRDYSIRTSRNITRF